MSDGFSASVPSPRRQWPLYLVVLLALGWIAAVVAPIAGHFAPAADGLPLVRALMPPLVAVLVAVSFLRAVRPVPDVADLEDRLARADADATRLHDKLAAVDVTLAECVARTERLAAAASADGDGLAASATRLAAAAGEVTASGVAADASATRIAAALPGLAEVQRRIDEMGGRLGSDTVRQLEVVDALLKSVHVRGDEVAVQADTAIASLNQQLADIDEASRATTSRIAKRAYALDAAVDGASQRSATLLDAVAERVGEAMTALDARLATVRAELDAVGDHGAVVIGARLDRLHASAGELTAHFAAADAASDALRRGVDDHLAALPGRLATARDDGATALDQVIARTAALRGDLDGLRGPFGAADTAMIALHARMDRLQAVADAFGATLEGGLPSATADLGRLEVSAAALDDRIAEVRAALAAGEVATRGVGSLVADLRRETAALGEADLPLVDDRMHATAAVLADIGRQIAAHGSLSAQTKALIEADLAALGTTLKAAHGDGAARLAALADHVGTVRDAADGLTAPMAAARRTLGDIEAQVGHVGEDSAALGAKLNAALAATVAEFSKLDERGTALIAGARELAAATDAGGTALATVTAQLADERDGFTATAASLGSEIDRIRTVLADLDAATAAVVAGSADDLGRSFDRARTLADENAAALRNTLATVVAETAQALGETGAQVAATAFADPIKLELGAVDDAARRAGDLAQAAALRVAGQARALGTTIDGVDARVAEIETRLEVRLRDTLSARSARLIELLHTASVDVARLLAMGGDEDVAAAYRRGDRSIFARRVVTIAEPTLRDKVARHFAHDAEFRDEATHYLDLFEALSRRLDADPDGDALLSTVVSSDLGKLYVALARATGRWLPAAA